ncbi:hypothetical protein HT746_35060 [Burkholderia pyrrocinia]|uniref:hypothetical protein n=1 Tax=Burkholderia pyrrocinia TaxID=60550 RepID=UPI001575793B|nr:hypothetical protein [Burkholderia pyrrocinia]NTX32269.1 hypothetical protein [Burkholderia pyrrocinia]QVN21106.1 hypothetical protein JYG32_31735 [Burkholderia pyrrocinia]
MIAVPLLATACGTIAHACRPPNYQTAYFGDAQHMGDELRDKVADDIRANESRPWRIRACAYSRPHRAFAAHA